MRQEGKGLKGKEDSTDLRSKMKVKKDIEREKTPKATVQLDHLEDEEEEERRPRKKKKDKTKKSKAKKHKKNKSNKNVDRIKLMNYLKQSDDDSDSDSSDNESMDSDLAEDMLKKIKILQKEAGRRKRGKTKKRKQTRSSSSSSDEEENRKSKKSKKKKKEKKKKKKKKRSPTKSDSESVSSSDGSSDSEDDDVSQRELEKRRRDLLAKMNRQEAVASKPARPIEKSIDQKPDVGKTKWERGDDEKSFPAKKPKIDESRQIPTEPVRNSDVKKRCVDGSNSNDEIVVIDGDKEAKQSEKKVTSDEIVDEGTSKMQSKLLESEKESNIVQEVRSIRYQSQSSSESTSKSDSQPESRSRRRSRSHPTSRLSSPYLSRSPSRSKSREYKEMRKIRYKSRSRSRSRQYRTKYYRSRSRSRQYRSRSRSGKYRSKSRSRHYRSRSRYRIRSRSRSRYRRSRSRSYKRRPWSKELYPADRRSPPRVMSLQERLDSAANRRRRELDQQASSSFKCGVKGSEEAVRGREEARREFQAQLDQIIVSHTTSGGQEAAAVPCLCQECGDAGHPVEECPDSEDNGKNPLGRDGKKQTCKHCGSYK